MATAKGAKGPASRGAGGGHGTSKASARGRDRAEALGESARMAKKQLDNLDEDLAVEAELGVSPDDLTDGESQTEELAEGAGGVTENEDGRPVIRDNRKVDPVSGKARAKTKPSDPAVQAALEDEVLAAAELIAAREELAVRTEDLQRVAAEYANYRKRVDRDRAHAGQAGRAEVLTAVIPVLDDIDAARRAGELDGPFNAVAEKLEAALAKFDLERYGAEGEAFDPMIHEALMHQTSPDVAGPTVTLVLQPGYRAGERVLRPARVAVTDSEA